MEPNQVYELHSLHFLSCLSLNARHLGIVILGIQFLYCFVFMHWFIKSDLSMGMQFFLKKENLNMKEDHLRIFVSITSGSE